jgi:hypothetical protein
MGLDTPRPGPQSDSRDPTALDGRLSSGSLSRLSAGSSDGDPPIVSPGTVVPPEIVVDVAPPADLQAKLQEIEKWALCGGRAELIWPDQGTAPWRGKRLTTFCAEPLCIETGSCTGPRFVPHLDQFTRDPEDPRTLRRKISAEEAIAGARESSRKLLGKEDPRTTREIARHIGKTWDRMVKGLRGGGAWRQ